MRGRWVAGLLGTASAVFLGAGMLASALRFRDDLPFGPVWLLRWRLVHDIPTFIEGRFFFLPHVLATRGCPVPPGEGGCCEGQESVWLTPVGIFIFYALPGFVLFLLAMRARRPNLSSARQKGDIHA